MINRILLFFKKKVPSVDEVLGQFSKTINDLEGIMKQKGREIEEKGQEIFKLEVEVREAERESSRAKSVVEKINKLIS